MVPVKGRVKPSACARATISAPDRATDRLTTGERGVHSAGPGVRLRSDHPVERLSLTGE